MIHLSKSLYGPKSLCGRRILAIAFRAFLGALPLLLLAVMQEARADSVPWNISLNAQVDDGGISPTYAMVAGTVNYNSNNPGLGTGVGSTVNIQPQPTTTYSNPTALGLTSATSQVSSTNNNDGYPWCIPSGCVSGTLTGSALATANLATGSVGVSADSDIIGNSLAESQTSSTAELTDQLTFYVANATASTVTDIGVEFTISGVASPGAPLTPGVAGPSVNMSGDLTLGAASAEYLYNDAAGDPADGTVFDGGWVSDSIVSQTPDSFIFTGVYQLTGPSAVVPITLYMTCGAENGGTCDYADTGAVSFDLPTGVSFTSASGVFLTEPLASTPEPASEAIVLGGLFFAALVLRGRRADRTA
ncbi:MAG TPA: hypothetical protein VME17_17115 [Bryobacteraceae bacterium]|nr:hypothetical protein [Bryobacteraceae bacterium]